MLKFFNKVDQVLGLSTEEEKEVRSIIEDEVEGVNENINTGKQEPEITIADVQEKTKDASEREDVIGVMAKNIPVFSECKNWRDVVIVVSKEGFKIQKEMFFIEVFAGGVCLVLLDNVTPMGKFVLGPLMVNMGYQNSKYLRKFTPNSFVDPLSRIEWEKVRGSRPQASSTV